MEYHEIGERFEYNGVVLEVIEAQDCDHCFFAANRICKLEANLLYCGYNTRVDKCTSHAVRYRAAITSNYFKHNSVILEPLSYFVVFHSSPPFGNKSSMYAQRFILQPSSQFLILSPCIAETNVS